MEKQVYLNLGAVLLGAGALGIDAVPMEGIDQRALDAQFGLREKGYTALLLVALRAEITKDAGALLALEAAHPALAERRVTPDRLAAMQRAGEGLAGLLAERAAAKGASKDATQIERKAAALQRDVWGGSYRLLAALGNQDAQVRALLSEAADSK